MSPGAAGARPVAPAIAVLLAAIATSVGAPADVDRRALERIKSPPLGLPEVPVPASNPPTTEKIRLGRKLFLDRRLSRNGTLSCAMCHVPEQGFTSNESRTAVGFEGRSLRRGAPTLLNVAYTAPYFHDGREPDLEMQPFDVFLNPDEMAAVSLGALVQRVRSLPDYTPLFERACGGPATVERIGQALATYLRTLVSGASPFDRWRFGGDAGAVGEPERRGFELFTGGARCSRCHTVEDRHALFTDHRFHDTGIAWFNTTQRRAGDGPVSVQLAPGVETTLPRSVVDSVGDPPASDLGRYEVTGDPSDRWRFKTPALRNVSLTAPYMHDGSLSSLRAVVMFYNGGAHPHDGLDPILGPLGLSDSQVDDLVAFLESLTGRGVDELVRDARSEEIGNPGGAAGPIAPESARPNPLDIGPHNREAADRTGFLRTGPRDRSRLHPRVPPRHEPLSLRSAGARL
jgi:cytochrome c peroxidase